MSYSPQKWRLLITPPSPGAWNMAVDEAIIEAVEKKLVPSTLRLYSWEPPCLSIGYAQPSRDIDLVSLNAFGWDWVRRPTGGRAILHTDELTYSVITPLSDPRVTGGVLESYRRLSKALLFALHSLGMPAQSLPNKNIEQDQPDGAVCFEVPSNYEIVIQGRKLIGSAQARRKNTLLQHGTLPLFGDLTRITQVLSFPNQQQRSSAANRLLSHATTVESILNKRIGSDDVIKSFIIGFESELDMVLTPAMLTEGEISRASELEREKYTHPSWLKRI